MCREGHPLRGCKGKSIQFPETKMLNSDRQDFGGPLLNLANLNPHSPGATGQWEGSPQGLEGIKSLEEV